MKLRTIRKRIVIFIVNHVLNGTRFFAAKRRLLRSIGYEIGENTKIVGPIHNTGTLRIGANCWIGCNLTVHGNGTVTIGDNCDIAPDVTFLTGGHQMGDHSRRAGKGESYHITVGSGVWIGGRVTLLLNTSIGDGSMIAACACVSKDVPADTMVAGVPAKVMKELEDFAAVAQNKVVRNAGWIIGGKIANKLLAFVVGIFAARYLGPSNYGLINYAAAYAAFFASLCTLGINSVIVKNFVDHPDQQGETIGTTLLLRAISSLLSALSIIGIVSVVDRGERLTVVVVALYSIGLIFQVFDTLNYWFQARLQSKYSAIAELVSYAAMSVYKIILLALGKSVEWFAVASALDYIVLAVFLLIAYFKNGGTRFRYSLEKAKELLQSSGSFIIAGLMVSIYACTDKLMLKQMLGADAVGHYSLASTVSVSWAFILSAIIDSLYPEIVQSFQKDRLRYERKNRQLYAIVFYVSLFVSAMICLVAKPFILILYGETYLPAVGPLRIVVWYTAFSYLGVARNAWMVCENRQKYLKYLYISAAALNIVLNLALIPPWGASGAAAASLITQISTTVILTAVIKPLRPNCRLMLDAVLLRGVLPERNERVPRRTQK